MGPIASTVDRRQLAPAGGPRNPAQASAVPVRPTAAAASLASSRFARGVAQLQGRIQADRQLQQVPDANGLKLRPGMESVFLPQKTPTDKGTVVMFHGYTAGPWQYTEMAQRFYQAGYNVYIPRLPGHGMETADGTPTGAEIPKSYQGQQYDTFVDQAFADASALGGPVCAVGLSGGADLALDMASRHPQVKSVAAMSPYLGGNGPEGWIFDIMPVLNKLTFGLAGRILDLIPEGKNIRVPGDPTPHTEGSLGQALAMLEVGRKLTKIPCPVQYLSTPGDTLSGSTHIAPLIQNSGGLARDGWFTFSSKLHVPHAMLSPEEDKVPGAAQRVSDIVFSFINASKLTDAK